MSLAFAGGSHRTVPIELREKLAFSSEQATEALALFQKQFPGSEAVLLSTCNRIELYAADEERRGPPPPDELAMFLAECRGIDPTNAGRVLGGEQGTAAVKHLFCVAAGLDSMVLGEPQIVAQVKQAWQLARQSGTTGPLTGELFQAALRAAKRVTTETAVGRERLSIPSIAVADFASGVFERFDDKRVLLIGAGKMAAETLRYLRDAGAQNIRIINRSLERAHSLAQRLEAQTGDYNNISRELVDADLVVSTTGASEPVVTLDLYQNVEDQRQGRPLVVLDLAVPRDFDSRIGTRPGVWLYSIDDLGQACDSNRRRRQNQLPAALTIVDEETRRFMGDMHHRSTVPVIEQLRAGWNETGEVELDRLFRKLPELDESSQKEIRQAFERYAAKMLHPPMASLRSESKAGPPHGLLEALRRLFDLKE